MDSIRKRHEDFIRELQAPLKHSAEAKPQRFKVVPAEFLSGTVDLLQQQV